MKHLLAVGVAAAAASWPVPVPANTAPLGAAGRWTAYGGTTVDNVPTCSLATSWNDGRALGFRALRGATQLQVLLTKPTWSIPVGAPFQITITIGAGTPWSVKGQASDPRALSFFVNNTMAFLKELTAATSLSVDFGEASERQWDALMDGFTGTLPVFVSCFDTTIRDTQPYSETPTSPVVPAHARPPHRVVKPKPKRAPPRPTIPTEYL